MGEVVTSDDGDHDDSGDGGASVQPKQSEAVAGVPNSPRVGQK